MSVATIMPHPASAGGIGTVIQWHRRWMEHHDRSLHADVYIDDFSRPFDLLRRMARGDIRSIPLPRLMPHLHFPQYYAGALLARRSLADVSEAHVLGGTAVHGSLVPPQLPTVVWIGTTIRDEWLSVAPLHPWYRRSLQGATLPILGRLEDGVLRNAKRILAQSPHTADAIVGSGIGSSRVEVQPVPVDTDIYQPGAGDRSGVLFVGRALDPRKRFSMVRELTRSSAVVQDAGIDVVSDRLDEATKQRAEVRWHGSPRDIAPLYRSAEVLVLPSIQEGLAIVAFEALASGTPVVAMRCGGPDRFIRASGGGVVAESTEEFARAVEQILKDEVLRADLGDRGREWVVENMSLRRFLDDPAVFDAG